MDLMSRFISCFNSTSDEFSTSSALLSGLGFAALGLASAVCFRAFFYRGQVVGMKMSVAISHLMYKKVGVPYLSNTCTYGKLKTNLTGSLFPVSKGSTAAEQFQGRFC